MKNKKLKEIVFHSSYEEQRSYGLQHSVDMNEKERIIEMNRLNRKLYGDAYGTFAKKSFVYKALPNETTNSFYCRIKNNG